MIVRLHDVGAPSGEAFAVRRRDEPADDSFQAALRRDLATSGYMVVLGPPLGGWRKRAFDIAAAAFGLVLLAPFLAVLALLVKLTDKGPVFYAHERIGYGGRRFKCWKFRTMSVDADARLKILLATDLAAALEWSATRKLRNDPRVTKFGDWLRRSSMDELPQLFNVLTGDMSLVGPRPVTLCELKEMGAGKKDYLNARPGLSGLWQISGRSNTTRSDRIALDRQYVKTWSLIGDFLIALKTVPAVLLRRGAY